MLYGIDIGGTKIEFAIYGQDLEPVETRRITTPKLDYQEFLSAIAKMVSKADQETGTRGSVGLGLPCVFDEQGRPLSANIPCINGQTLLEDLTQLISRPVTSENDANALTLSEANGGAADGASTVLGVILGTGVSGGLCIDGKLYRSKQNIAGEFGHVPLSSVSQQRYQFPLRPCGCGLTGCAEQYLAGPGLLWLCSHFQSEYISVPELIYGVKENEAGAVKVFNAYIDCLGCYFAQLILMYDPDTIVLGGGLSNIEEIYQLLPTAIQGYLISTISSPEILPPKFGDSSGVRGAALSGHKNA